MESTWFVLLAFMLSAYVVLDGFDFGAGILHLLVARTDQERRTVLAAIGPLWDGNEVWLLAFGGVLVFSFPRVYAVAFSGFYLALMLVLWLLILRGISIEFRSHHPNPLWRAFWDAGFAFGSFALAIVFGAALGNVIRGVPIGQSGFFLAPFFGDFRASSASGALDWYTVAVGVFALLVLAGHGALYLAWKTDGAVETRSLALAKPIWIAVVLLGGLLTAATANVQPTIFHNLVSRGPLWLVPPGLACALAAVFFGLAKRRALTAFLGSSGFIVGMLGATAGALYPTLLRSTIDPSLSLTVHNASAGRSGLAIGLMFWVPAMLLAIGYFAYLFRSHSGKVRTPSNGEGY
jgi:cytochrome bd ubiquinol oxidase subunit II